MKLNTPLRKTNRENVVSNMCAELKQRTIIYSRKTNEIKHVIACKTNRENVVSNVYEELKLWTIIYCQHSQNLHHCNDSFTYRSNVPHANQTQFW